MLGPRLGPTSARPGLSPSFFTASQNIDRSVSRNNIISNNTELGDRLVSGTVTTTVSGQSPPLNFVGSNPSLTSSGLYEPICFK